MEATIPPAVPTTSLCTREASIPPALRATSLSQGRLLAACSNSQATASTVGAALAAARQERLNMDMKSSMKQFPCISLRATARVAPTVYHVFLIIHVCCIVPSDCNEYRQPKASLVKGRGTALAVEGLGFLRYGDNPSGLRPPPFHKGGIHPSGTSCHPTGPLAGKACSTL